MSIIDRSVVTIGNFDGVHLGHRTIVKTACHVAAELKCQVTAITFDPSPADILRPTADHQLLMSTEDKCQALRDAGADNVVVLRPTPAFLTLTPEQFLESVVEIHSAAAFVEGPDFRFGRSRTGDNRMLREQGKELGFQTHIVKRVEATLSDHSVVSVSSSLIRWLIHRGRVLDAGRCLGAPYRITANVVNGQGRGRQMGVPTANLDARELAGMAIPADGVYAGYAALADGTLQPAAVSVGSRPTFGGSERCVEAHLFDYDGNLYNQRMTIHWTRWVRDQWLFADAGDLRQQIQRDLDRLRHWLGSGYFNPGPQPAPSASAA